MKFSKTWRGKIGRPGKIENAIDDGECSSEHIARTQRINDEMRKEFRE